jgi:hypothetical protein
MHDTHTWSDVFPETVGVISDPKYVNFMFCN